jgi:hypothetical protein
VCIVSVSAFATDMAPSKTPSNSRSTTPAQAHQNTSGKI